MKSLFNFDNPFVRAMRKFAYIWVLNFIFILTSLPIFTIGASITALNYACMKLHEEEGYPFRNYFDSFKLNFKQSTCLFLIYFAYGAILAGDLIIANSFMAGWQRDIFWVLAFILAIPFLLSIIYVFAIQARFVNTVKNTIKFSFGISIKHFMTTLQIILILAAVLYLNFSTNSLVNYLTIIFGFGLFTYWFTFYYNLVFDPYIRSKREIDALNEANAEVESYEEESD